jgi:hypothetical protein
MRLTGLVSKCAFKDWQCVANAVDRLALREPIDGLLTLRASGIVTPVQEDYNLRGRTPKADVDVCFNGNIAVSGEVAVGRRNRENMTPQCMNVHRHEAEAEAQYSQTDPVS